MSVYILGFIITLISSYINEKNLLKENTSRFIHRITAVLIILIPAVIAGVRSYGIGVDTQLYAKPIFEYSLSCSNFSSILQRYSDIEPGFLLISYLVSRVASDPHVFLFCISAIIQLLVYCSLYKVKERCSILLGEGVFLFTMFNASMNIMRQMLALAIFIFAVTFILEKKYIKAIVIILVGMLFHKTIIVGLLYIPVFVLINQNPFERAVSETKNKRNMFYFKVILIALSVTALSAFVIPVLGYFTSAGILGERYLQYSVASRSALNIRFFLVYILSLPIIYVRRNKNYHGYAWLSIGAIEIILYLLKTVMYYLVRISYYYMIGRVLSLSQFRINFGRIIRTQKITKEELLGLLGLGTCIVYWYVFIVVNNDNGTVPYIPFWR